MNPMVPSDHVPTIVEVRCGCAAHRSPQADRVRRARIRALQEPEAQAIAVGRIGTTGAACLAVILDVARAGLPGAASDLPRAPAAAAPCPPARCPRGDSAPIGESRPWQVRKVVAELHGGATLPLGCFWPLG